MPLVASRAPPVSNGRRGLKRKRWREIASLSGGSAGRQHGDGRHRRQDFNIDPLSFWQKNDTEDRRGITENKYVMGYLGYFDELLRRHDLNTSPHRLMTGAAVLVARHQLFTLL